MAKEVKPGRDAGGKFKKGVSGNPGGKRPIPEDVKKALEELVPDAIDRLKEIVQDRENVPAATAVKAAEAVLDRVYGKPVQSTELDIGAKDNNKMEVVFSSDLEKWSK